MRRRSYRIEANIVARHVPHGTILDPISASPQSLEIVRYTRGGDSAIWTGHYLAAEVYRYRATGEAEALANVRATIEAIGGLVCVTGTNLLARAVLPASSPWAPGIEEEEQHHGIYRSEIEGEPVIWLGNTSRDQYLGVFFGLSAAYELIFDEEIRASITDVVTRMLEFLLDRGWAVTMPDGSVSTVFWHRVDQRLALLHVGRQVNDARFSEPYRAERLFGSLGAMAPVTFETLDPHNSYFKFNLVAIGMFALVRQETAERHRGRYMSAYRVFRRAVEHHGNAHFNLIDRVLEGPDARRDRETVRLLAAWMERPNRDFFVDWRGQVAECGENRACEPLPVEARVNTDFLWQRSPFQLYGGGDGFIVLNGLDFILPYWMGRFFGVL